jgi:peptide/nickel transport system permease protein
MAERASNTPTAEGRLGPIGLERVLEQARSSRLRLWRRMPVRGRVAIIWLLILIFVAIFATVIAPYGANQDQAGPLTAAPSLAHIFGTDSDGRDVFSRVLVGARISVLVAFLGPLAPAIIGSAIGAAAALSSKITDEVLMRLMDIQFAFPAIVLALVLAAVIGPSLSTTLLVMTLVYTPIMARFVRASVRAQFAEDYASVARASGASRLYVLRRHLAPNMLSPMLVFLSLVGADAVLLEAALSFLGAGVQPPTPTWGNLLQDGSQEMLAGNWWLTVFPGLAIFSLVLALNTLSEAIADRLGGGEHTLGEG